MDSCRFEKPEEGCPMCLEQFTDEDKPLETCSHWVHKKCIAEWGKPVCPICREPVVLDKELGEHAKKRWKEFRKDLEERGFQDLQEAFANGTQLMPYMMPYRTGDGFWDLIHFLMLRNLMSRENPEDVLAELYANRSGGSYSQNPDNYHMTLEPTNAETMNPKDVQLVAEQAGVNLDIAEQVLREHAGDIVNAIMWLCPNR